MKTHFKFLKNASCISNKEHLKKNDLASAFELIYN